MGELPVNQEFYSEETIEVGRDGSSGLYETPNESRLKGWKAFVQHIHVARGPLGRFVQRRKGGQ